MDPTTSPSANADLAALQTMLDRFQQMEGLLVAWKEEVKRHFEITSEHSRRDAFEAHQGDIEKLQDVQNDHEARLSRLEKSAGTIA